MDKVPPMTKRWPTRGMARCAWLALGWVLSSGGRCAEAVLPELVGDLACHYDFEHPLDGDPTRERDLGFSGTALGLVNGGAAMRVSDGAHAASRRALETRQIDPEESGNNDWKAGIYEPEGVASLAMFGSASGISLMGWVKPTGVNPAPDSRTPESDDFYNAVGLFGLLAGDSQGHGVRALIELIDVSGTLRLVALGRRLDGGQSKVLAAGADWETLLPAGEWTHLSASFDFDEGSMALYRNGLPVEASPLRGGDPWRVDGEPEPDLSSPTPPAGIKVGGSYPQNTEEKNAFNGRFDELMFFTRALEADEVLAQFRRFATDDPPRLDIACEGDIVTLLWSTPATGYVLESSSDLAPGGWSDPGVDPVDEGDHFRVSLPWQPGRRFFRLHRDDD